MIAKLLIRVVFNRVVFLQVLRNRRTRVVVSVRGEAAVERLVVAVVQGASFVDPALERSRDPVGKVGDERELCVSVQAKFAFKLISNFTTGVLYDRHNHEERVRVKLFLLFACRQVFDRKPLDLSNLVASQRLKLFGLSYASHDVQTNVGLPDVHLDELLLLDHAGAVETDLLPNLSARTNDRVLFGIDLAFWEAPGRVRPKALHHQDLFRTTRFFIRGSIESRRSVTVVQSAYVLHAFVQYDRSVGRHIVLVVSPLIDDFIEFVQILSQVWHMLEHQFGERLEVVLG